MGLGVIAGLVETAPDFWRTAPLTALAALIILGIGAIVVLLRANRRMQAEQSALVEYQTPPAE
jgi:ABC-type multidrug transport system permease subunit